MRPKRLHGRHSVKAELVRLAADQAAGDSGRPPSGCSAEQLAAVNQMPQVLRPLTADQLFVRSAWAINDQPLFNGLRIETAGIATIAELAPGKPVIANHDTYGGRDALPFARIFAGSSARRVDDSTWAKLGFWIIDVPDDRDLVSKMDGGTVAECSVSIGYDMVECSICQTDLWDCAHSPGRTYDGKLCEGIIRGVEEFYELSLVWAGMARGTSLLAAGRDVDEGDVIAALLARETALRNAPAPDFIAELCKAEPREPDELDRLLQS